MGEYAEMAIDDALDRMMRHFDSPEWWFDDYDGDDDLGFYQGRRRRRERREPPEAIAGILFGVLRDACRSRAFSERLARLKVITRNYPCPCGSRLTFRTSYSGAFFGCATYPECRYTVSADENGFPSSFPVDDECRQLRKKAHKLFDPLWKSGLMTRHRAYEVLAQQFNLTSEEAHFAQMNIPLLRRVILWLKKDAKVIRKKSRKSYRKRERKKFHV